MSETSAADQRVYRYRAVDAVGAESSGEVRAVDEQAAARELLRRGLTPLRMQGQAQDRVRTVRAAGPAEQLVLIQELATLLRAGISLSEALPSLAQAYAEQGMGPPLAATERAVRSGARLSEALRGSGLALPPYVLALVEAGEASGALAEALTDAASQMDHDRRAAQELRNALIYPTVLVCSGVLAVLIIFVGVVPRFATLLKSSRAEVPAISRVTIESGLFVKQHLLAFGLGGTALIILITAMLASAPRRAQMFELAGRAPVVGQWLMRVDLGRWASVLGSLLANRVPIITAVQLSAGALRLARLRNDLGDTARELERGRSFSEVLGTKGWFPAARLNLVRVGERSGELPRMLSTLGEMETEAARLLQKRVLALIEPAAILIIGAVIGFIMVAVMMAITSLNSVAV